MTFTICSSLPNPPLSIQISLFAFNPCGFTVEQTTETYSTKHELNDFLARLYLVSVVSLPYHHPTQGNVRKEMDGMSQSQPWVRTGVSAQPRGSVLHSLCSKTNEWPGACLHLESTPDFWGASLYRLLWSCRES